jgi:hypothetical protein
MIQYGTWRAHTAMEAIILSVVLFVIAGLAAYLGTRLHHPVGVQGPGRTVGVLLALIWVLAYLSVGNASIAYYLALVKQIGPYTPPASPISLITLGSGLIALIIIAYLSRHHGWRLALGSAVLGTIAAPMIFELPFDLIVMWRTYPPTPATMFTLLLFFPLFIWELSSYALLTWSPLMRISKYTLFTLAAVFLVFAVWALFGFSYPSSAIPFALNAISKVLCYVTAITLFLPLDGVGSKSPSSSS